MSDTHKTFKTTPYLTKFEFARVLSLRVLQLSADVSTSENAYHTAKREILEGSNPAYIRRRLPDGTHEDRRVATLRLPADVRRMCLT